MKDKRKLELHEQMYGPHFNERCALKAVALMENEDGTIGQHWSLSETTTIAAQFGINLSTYKYNKYDWYVALNMIYSDYYKAIRSICNSDNVKYFVEFAKAWIDDKDIDDGKMWYYYKYIMCDTYREEPYEEPYEDYRHKRYPVVSRKNYLDRYEDDYNEEEYKYKQPFHERIGSRY